MQYVVTGLVLCAVLAGCGGGASLSATTACENGFICEQWEYDLRGLDLPPGFNLGLEIESVDDACRDGGGTALESCPDEGVIASCEQSGDGITETRFYSDPGLTDEQICDIQADCESKDGSFDGPSDLSCDP
ncbi:MAG: hypothetical protein KIT79_07885 [Deltaproteobacteria bacterium]|nr:hypothetical protein [Deltaproteobacteria bacterium]